jgi:hypothetical protein
MQEANIGCFLIMDAAKDASLRHASINIAVAKYTQRSSQCIFGQLNPLVHTTIQSSSVSGCIPLIHG